MAKAAELGNEIFVLDVLSFEQPDGLLSRYPVP